MSTFHCNIYTVKSNIYDHVALAIYGYSIVLLVQTNVVAMVTGMECHCLHQQLFLPKLALCV